MKIFGQEKLLGAAPIETLIRYTLSLPVAAAVLGMPQLSYVEENTAIAKRFQPLGKEQMRRLSGDLSRQYKVSLDRFFANHVDA
jgi:predicted aldo/keto reductase-like oxidoreductase